MPVVQRAVVAEGSSSDRRGSRGYCQSRSGECALLVVEIDAAAEAEDDDLLRLFGHGEARTVEARRWLSQQSG
ncbi:hypothetical protein WMF45_20430 [Sorangium sp. So ce448]|uniref:hypothetical protein n=1 Tax=Sorangium sp. So ce448 TaxID=3133314 RepID=UPI003F615F52